MLYGPCDVVHGQGAEPGGVATPLTVEGGGGRLFHPPLGTENTRHTHTHSHLFSNQIIFSFKACEERGRGQSDRPTVLPHARHRAGNLIFV